MTSVNHPTPVAVAHQLFMEVRGDNGGKKIIDGDKKDSNLQGKDGQYGGGGGSGGYNRIGLFDLYAYAGGKGGDGCVALWYGAYGTV